MERERISIGIDPGAAGAIAAINDRKQILYLSTYSKEGYIFMLRALQQEHPEAEFACCLEHVGAMPGQGVVSMFKFGENFGWIQGVLETLGIPFELVRPQKWKKEFSITSDKNTSVEVCRRLFPDAKLKKTDRCRKDDDGLAEALLMAEYARRKL